MNDIMWMTVLEKRQSTAVPKGGSTYLAKAGCLLYPVVWWNATGRWTYLVSN